MKRFIYVTENGILKGFDDVTNQTMRNLYKTIAALKTIGRDGFVSNKGITICSVCNMVMHEKEIPAGEISHSYCPKHYKEALVEFDSNNPNIVF